MDQMCNCNLYDLCKYLSAEVVTILKAWDNWDEVLDKMRNEYLS